jgi:hypothetical protein
MYMSFIDTKLTHDDVPPDQDLFINFNTKLLNIINTYLNTPAAAAEDI